LALGTRIVLAVHILAVLLWIGSLWPMREICSASDQDTLSLIMTRYGRIAVFIVVVVLLSGFWMILQLLNEPHEIITTSYGRVLSLKLLGVAGLLAIAARHKFILVPDLNKTNGATRLQRSIDIEVIIALLVVLCTAVVTTAIGPAMNA
jgi:putative copper resistance protein D